MILLPILLCLSIIQALRMPKTIFRSTSKVLVDLRTESVIKPTKSMRKAMMDAEVGDDVYGEDPTVNILQDRIAKMFGKEKALFFPSGTMSNLAAVLSWCQRRGSEMILGDKSHIHIYEQGGVSQLGGVATHNLPNNFDGTMDLDKIVSSIRSPNIHFPVTDLICIENTHHVCGGRVLPLSYVNDLSQLCRRNNIPLHMDGARIWNAAVASGVSVRELVENVDSVSVSLSKSLGAPVGSILTGSEEMIDRARRMRKALGGGMRQCGVLAAAALQALDDFEKGVAIETDHRRTKALGESLANIPVIKINPNGGGIIETNILMFELDQDGIDAPILVEKLKEKGILALSKGPKLVSMVLHRDISDEDTGFVAKVLEEVISFSSSEKAVNVETSEDLILKESEPAKQQTGMVADEDRTSSLSSSLSTVIASSTPPVSVSAATIGEITVEANNSTIVAKSLEEDHVVPSSSVCSLTVPYESSFVCGMSVSDVGFCVFLQGSISDRIVKIIVNPIDPMVDGLDREQVESSEAVTLLQLLQDIDVETFLPHDSLAMKFYHCPSPSSSAAAASSSSSLNTGNSQGQQKHQLRKVMLHQLKPFSASLHGYAGGKLSLPSLLPSAASAIDDKSKESKDTVMKPLSSLDMNSLQSLCCSLSTLLLPSNDKTVRVDNSFEAIALALRYDTSIEILSELMNDPQSSYQNLEQLHAEYPQLLLKPDLLTFEERQMKIRNAFFEYNNSSLSSPEIVHKLVKYIDLFSLQLIEAKRQQKDDKVNVLFGTLELILSKLQLQHLLNDINKIRCEEGVCQFIGDEVLAGSSNITLSEPALKYENSAAS
jgi:threonine aldolase